VISLSPEELAREFWAGTNLQDTFPRNIEQAIALKLPLGLVKLPLLTIGAVRRWLEKRQILIPVSTDPCDLLGCLLAYRGYGFIFVSGSDGPAEQRFTIAHEVAHFLVDYLWPRRQVIQALGEDITEVLDGLRPATPAERAAAILSHLRLGAHLHVLPRPGTDEDQDSVVASAENRADRLALELVAPQKYIRSFLQNLFAHQAINPHDARAALVAHFGLPAYAFDAVTRRMKRYRPTSFLAEVRQAIGKQ
jgi:hypothetical protein